MKFFLFSFIFLMPVAFAIECSSSNSYCNEVLNSNLNDSEKDYLISSLVHEKVNFPNHEFVYEYNLDIKLENIRNKVVKTNQGYIKDAFVKLIAVMPSVIENNSLFVNNGIIYSLFEHKIILPTGTASGDCYTRYSVANHNSALNAYSDTNYLGSGNLVNFSINSDSNLNVRYNVNLITRIDHYRLRTYCCSDGEEGCEKYCSVCEHSYTEQKNDNLVLTDSFKVKYYNLKLNASFNIINKYFYTVKGVLNTTNFTGLEFKFADSYFNKYNYFYTLNWSDLDAITVKAENYPVESSANLIKDNEFLIKNTDDCKIILYDFFKKQEFDCNLSFKKIDISLTTDKLTYYENDTIYIDLYPKDFVFNLTYANKTYKVKDKFELKAIPFENKIKISYNSLEYEKYIYVKDSEKWNFLFNLIIFIGVNFSIVKVSEKVFKKIWNAD